MIGVLTGLPGAGKSYKMAQIAINTLYRNKKWYERQCKAYKETPELFVPQGELLPQPPKMRELWSNLRFTDEVAKEFDGFIQYWNDPSQLVKLRNVDVLWDEIATHLDSTQWQNMSLEIKRWLQQHRKFGIEIYGTTQDFAMIDKSMRRLTSDLVILRKLVGSRDVSPTRPPVKFVWGVVACSPMDPTTYDEDKSKKMAGIPTLMFITKAGVNIFDTTQEITMGKYPPLNHIERECITPNCGFHKITHA